MNKKILSLGAGRQSSLLAIFASEGKLDADMAIFSDPGNEMPKTYEFLINELIPYCETRKFPIIWLKANGDYFTRPKIYDYYYQRKTLPFRVSRSCTDNWKIRPINRFIKDKYPNAEVTMYLGFTMNEMLRMKDNKTKGFTNQYPLIDMKIWDHDLPTEFKKRDLSYPVKSGCFFCPFNRKAEWKNLLYNYPRLFNKAMKLEENSSALLNSREIPLRKLKSSKSKQLWEMLNVEDPVCGSSCMT